MTRHLRILLTLALMAAAAALLIIGWPAPHGAGLAGAVALAAVFVAPVEP